MPVWDPNANAIFGQALECATPAERQAFCDQACGDDRDLRQKVEQLLASHRDAGSLCISDEIAIKASRRHDRPRRTDSDPQSCQAAAQGIESTTKSSHIFTGGGGEPAQSSTSTIEPATPCSALDLKSQFYGCVRHVFSRRMWRHLNHRTGYDRSSCQERAKDDLRTHLAPWPEYPGRQTLDSGETGSGT